MYDNAFSVDNRDKFIASIQQTNPARLQIDSLAPSLGEIGIM